MDRVGLGRDGWALESEIGLGRLGAGVGRGFDFGPEGNLGGGVWWSFVPAFFALSFFFLTL